MEKPRVERCFAANKTAEEDKLEQAMTCLSDVDEVCKRQRCCEGLDGLQR